jgi:hypothetical protein
MAGSAKPSNVKREANYTVNGYQFTQCSGGLFNGVITGDYTSWYDTNAYIDITINNRFNLWTYPIINYTTESLLFKVYRYVNNTWVDCTSELQEAQRPNVTSWFKSFTSVPAGRYKFNGVGHYRSDAEWYIESYTSYLIKQSDNQFYNLSTDYYNDTLHKYVPILTLNGGNIPNITDYSNYGFANPSDMNNSITKNTDTFKPISKFSNFNIRKVN